MGAVRGTSIFLHHLHPGQTYYWTVQAVDTSFAGSPFASEAQFTTSTNSLPVALKATYGTNGVVEFSFVSTPGKTFSVVAATDPSLPLTDWIKIRAVTEISAGQFHFTDPEASKRQQHFYRVRSP
jgi:hypothetical protein